MATTSAVRYSVNRFAGDGVTTIWNFNFAGGYISPDHVKARVIDAAGNEADVSRELVGTSQVKVTPAVALNSYLEIYRDTPKDQPLSNFTDGSVLTEATLDANAKQAVFIAAEAVDAYSVTDSIAAAALVAADLALTGASSGSGASVESIRAALGINSLVSATFTPTDVAAPSSAAITAMLLGTASDLIGFTATGSTTLRKLKSKLGDVLDVADFGAVGDGVTDDYPAFVAAKAAARLNQRIRARRPAVAYYLSDNPDPSVTTTAGGITHTIRPKGVQWDIDPGCPFVGPGVGLPLGLGPQFLSQLTNPYNQTFGSIMHYDFSGLTTLNGGCLIGDTKELGEDFGYGIAVTGDLTNGQATISNASGSFLGVIKRGDRIESSAAGWPNGPYMQVWSVTANTITFGIDLGAGPGGPTNFSGTSQVGASFTIYKKQWMALEYRGVNTGGPNSRAMAYGIRNDVGNITGGPMNAYEIDLIALADPGIFSRGIFMTGHGDAPATMTAIDIQRAGGTPWASAIAVRAAIVGMFLNAKNPISIDTQYNNPQTGLPENINFGVHFNNAPAIRGGLLEGRMITDNSQAIVVWRNTDTNPSSLGRAFQFMNAANTAELAFIDNFGNGAFNQLQLNQVVVNGAFTPTGYITIKGAGNQTIKIPASIG